jgi:hypothetical protein
MPRTDLREWISHRKRGSLKTSGHQHQLLPNSSRGVVMCRDYRTVQSSAISVEGHTILISVRRANEYVLGVTNQDTSYQNAHSLPLHYQHYQHLPLREDLIRGRKGE